MTMRTLAPSLAALVLAAPSPALANDDFQQWLSVSVKADLSEKIAVQDELVVRLSDDRGGLYELENSLLLGYKFNKKAALWAGYVHNPTYNGGDFAVMEHRVRTQLTVDDFAKIGSASIGGRFRVEHRWRDGIDGAAWRARPQIKAGIPLGDKSAPTLNLSAEAFVNLNNTSFQSTDGLERLRSAAALSFPVAKGVKLEAGYLNQHRFVRGGPDTDDHVLTASIGVSF